MGKREDWTPEDGKLGATGQPQRPMGGATGVILAVVLAALILFAIFGG